MNELFLQVYGAQYLRNVVNEALCSVDGNARSSSGSLRSNNDLVSDDDDDESAPRALLWT
ncbi:MAG: hypothetical protein EOO65_03460 [Methanosarcinales archaeon]|nr:MAG: hypothetical protein EOO65_03460 [Methanosarcinales archaeon]